MSTDHMTAEQPPREYSADNWAHQALLKMDVAQGLVNWACVTMEKERYERVAAAFWEVAHMLADERQRIEDARLSGMAAAQWQPIETAPLGRKILVAYRNELGNWRRVMAMYYLADTLEMEEGSFDWDTESGYAPAGWYEEYENGDHAYPISATLELWCELPALPATPEVPKC